MLKNPYFVIRRMCERLELSYDLEKDVFAVGESLKFEDVFMSIEEINSFS